MGMHTQLHFSEMSYSNILCKKNKFKQDENLYFNIPSTYKRIKLNLTTHGETIVFHVGILLQDNELIQ